MRKKLVFLVVVMGMWLSPAAQSTTIVWVADAINDAAGVPYDQGWIDLLTARGYTVDVRRGLWETLNDTLLETLNNADLVIVSRATSSGNYASNTTEVTQWNSVKTPLICMSAFFVRSSQWVWMNSGIYTELAAQTTMQVVKADHPIFANLPAGTSNVDMIDGAVDSGRMLFITHTNPGNGTILATRADNGNIWIQEWAAGTPFYGTSPQTPAGKRLFFTAGGGGGQTAGSLNFTAAGRKLFVNAVLYMMGKSLRVDIALDPSPENGKTDVPRSTDLAWTAGEKAVTHDVYFGTNFVDVNAASSTNPGGVLVAQGQSATTFDPGVLQLGRTYYWRVDGAEQNGTLHQGEVWSFTVEPVVYEVTGITATASSSEAGLSPTHTVDRSGLTGDQHGADEATMWLSAADTATPIWLQYDLGKVCKLQDMWVWNYNVEFEELLGWGIQNATVEYSVDGMSWTTLGSFDFAQGISAPGYDHNTTIPFGGVAVQYVKITVNSNYGGDQTGLSEVRFYHFPVSAREPNPATGVTGVASDVTLSWRAGREAASHNVYTGTDPEALTLAGTVTINSFAPGNLGLGTRYYWRVDEVNTAEAVSTWAGAVWSFTTSPFITVDDMERYNDQEGTSVFSAWVDGYSTPATNGGVVGLATAVNGTFCSTAIFHAGRQSMPLTYNNSGSVTNSEATRTFSDTEGNWTKSAVATLTLYFYGQAGNTTTVPLYVRLADQSGKTAKVTFGSAAGEDPIVLADPAWTTWSIPLGRFSGINLTKVKSMTIGLGDGSGKGTLYIDDIRLDPPLTAAPAVTPTLVGWWKLDNDVKDSSGSGNNGTIIGTPTYVAAGKIGAALKLNGTTDYVDCGNAGSVNITDVITLSAWFKPANFANSAYQTFISKGDNAYVLAQTNANLLQLAIYDGTWYSANSAAVTSTMNGSWHHVASTYDGTQLRLYVDGQMAASTLRTGVIAQDTHVLSLGRNSQNTGRLFHGELDDVRIYHGALPTADIKKLANP